MFDLLIIIETSKELRKKRIIDREYDMYGERFKVDFDNKKIIINSMIFDNRNKEDVVIKKLNLKND